MEKTVASLEKTHAAVTSAVLILAACQGQSPGQLEEEASSCENRAALSLTQREHFIAFNAYYLQEEAARSMRNGLTESPFLEEILRKATRLGVRVLRTWAFNDAPEKLGDSAIQFAPLQYDEISLRGLDLVLARAWAYQIQLVLPLGNYWSDYGGARQYVEWARLPSPVEGDSRFFTERAVIEHYKQYIRTLLSRVNTVDGFRYADHPAVLAWELLNEPRNSGLDESGNQLRGWIDEIGAAVRADSPHKLIGTGEEGFEPNFRKNLASQFVDFGSVHFFPESWGFRPEAVASAGAQWFSQHAQIARELGKPLLVGEFGLRNNGAFTLAERRAIYRGWLDCARRAGLAGVSPWLFAYDLRPDEWDPHTFYFREGTATSDPQNRYADILEEAANF